VIRLIGAKDEKGGTSLSLTSRLFHFYAEVREGSQLSHCGLLIFRERLNANQD